METSNPKENRATIGPTQDGNGFVITISGGDLRDFSNRMKSLMALLKTELQPLSPKESEFLYLNILAYQKYGTIYSSEAVEFLMKQNVMNGRLDVYKYRRSLVDKGYMIKEDIPGQKRQKVALAPLLTMFDKYYKIVFDYGG